MKPPVRDDVHLLAVTVNVSPTWFSFGPVCATCLA